MMRFIYRGWKNNSCFIPPTCLLTIFSIFWASITFTTIRFCSSMAAVSSSTVSPKS